MTVFLWFSCLHIAFVKSKIDLVQLKQYLKVHFDKGKCGPNIEQVISVFSHSPLFLLLIGLGN